MSVWANRRKQRQHKPPPSDPVEDLTIRVAHRLCGVIYAKGCDCRQRGLNQVCDIMKLAAQHAFSEIKGQ